MHTSQFTNVSRYGMTRASASVDANPVQQNDGPWVSYSDYVKLLRYTQGLEAEVKALLFPALTTPQNRFRS
jgi:hypothetical protein